MTEAINQPTGVLVDANPHNLMIESNVRTEASLTKQFVASIKENGVLVPIVALRDDNGTLWVRAGQRRTLAAREAGLESVPVYIIDAGSDEATRLVQQITENDQRLSLGAGDRVKGIQQLLDTGLSMTRVAKRLAVSPERVKQSKAVAGSAVAMAALQERSATLEEAAAIAEFEDDEDEVERLLRAAGRNSFDFELRRARDRRNEAAQRAAAAASWVELGYTVYDAWPAVGSGAVSLGNLLTADGNGADQSVVTDPKQWGVYLEEFESFVDAEGNPVDEQTIDWATEHDDDAVPEEGLVHFNSVTAKSEWEPVEYFCLDPEAAGLTVSERYTKLAVRAGTLDNKSGGLASVEAEEARRVAEKAERRRVIAMNKAGEAAVAVRREFVTGLLKRKSLPDGALVFLAETLAGDDGRLFSLNHGSSTASELLGGEVRSGELLDHVTDNRAGVVILGMALGAMESVTGKSAWRGPGDLSIRYLRFLAANGYGLSPVEQVIVGDLSVEACLEALA